MSERWVINGHYDIHDVYLSLPTVVNRGGVEQVLRLNLAPDEVEALRRSAAALRSSIDQIIEA